MRGGESWWEEKEQEYYFSFKINTRYHGVKKRREKGVFSLQRRFSNIFERAGDREGEKYLSGNSKTNNFKRTFLRPTKKKSAGKKKEIIFIRGQEDHLLRDGEFHR